MRSACHRGAAGRQCFPTPQYSNAYQQLEEALAVEAEEATLRARSEAHKAFTEWVGEALVGGAAAAHAYVKGKGSHATPVIKGIDGSVRANPREVLEHHRDVWHAQWTEGRSVIENEGFWDELDLGNDGPELPPPLGVDELRTASRTFRHRTSVGPDGLHVRHFCLVSDGGL